MDKQKPFVSVVMPTYNQACFIKEAIDSVLRQSYENFELIIIDNHSDDPTEEIILDYQERDSRVKYIKFHNQGIIAASRNLGIEKAKGELIAFIDSDDIWLPEKLEKQIQCFQDEKLFAVATKAFWMKENMVLPKYYFAKKGYYDCGYRDFLFSNHAVCSSVIARKDILQDLKGFDQQRDFICIEDWELWLRIANKGKFRILNEPLLFYRIQPNKYQQAVESSKRRFKVIDKHLKSISIKNDELKEAKANINLFIAVNLLRLEDSQSKVYFFKAFKSALRFKTKIKAFGGYLLSIMPVKMLKVLRFLLINCKLLGCKKIKDMHYGALLTS